MFYVFCLVLYLLLVPANSRRAEKLKEGCQLSIVLRYGCDSITTGECPNGNISQNNQECVVAWCKISMILIMIWSLKILKNVHSHSCGDAPLTSMLLLAQDNLEFVVCLGNFKDSWFLFRNSSEKKQNLVEDFDYFDRGAYKCGRRHTNLKSQIFRL